MNYALRVAIKFEDMIETECRGEDPQGRGPGDGSRLDAAGEDDPSESSPPCWSAAVLFARSPPPRQAGLKTEEKPPKLT